LTNPVGLFDADSRTVELRFAAALTNLAMLRAALSGYVVNQGLDEQSGADLVLAVNEACSGLIAHSDAEALLTLRLTDRPGEICVEASTTTTLAQDPLDDFVWQVLTAFAENVQAYRYPATAAQPASTGISLVVRTSVDRDGN